MESGYSQVGTKAICHFTVEQNTMFGGGVLWSDRLYVFAIVRPFGTKGSALRRVPVASKMAFPMAGATAMIGVSPAPADGRSLRSKRTASTSGTSRKRG